MIASRILRKYSASIRDASQSSSPLWPCSFTLRTTPSLISTPRQRRTLERGSPRYLEMSEAVRAARPNRRSRVSSSPPATLQIPRRGACENNRCASPRSKPPTICRQSPTACDASPMLHLKCLDFPRPFSPPFVFACDGVFNRCMLRLQRRVVLAGWPMRRRLRQIFENEAAFTIGVICLAFLPVAMMLAALFIK